MSSVSVPFEVIVNGLWSRDCKCTWPKGSLYKQKLGLKIGSKCHTDVDITIRESLHVSDTKSVSGLIHRGLIGLRGLSFIMAWRGLGLRIE